MQDLQRIESKWDEILDLAFLTEDIIKTEQAGSQSINSVFWIPRSGSIGQLLDKASWLWHVRMRHMFSLFLLALFLVCSTLVFLGELSTFTTKEISIFYLLLDAQEGFFSIQFFALIPLTYITLCVYYSLFNVKLAGFFGFYNDHNTDAPSLLFGSM